MQYYCCEMRGYYSVYPPKRWVLGFGKGCADLDGMDDEMIRDRFSFAQNCLKRFGELDASSSEALHDELDYLRKSMLLTNSKLSESNQHLKSARNTFPKYILQAISHLSDLNPVPPLLGHTNTSPSILNS